MSFRSNPDPTDHHEPHPWLEEKVYAKLRQRTVDLVKQSIDALRKDKQRVSLATVAAKSKELDPEHRGISESAILDNQEARAYYEQHRSWRGSSRKRTKPLVVASPAQPLAVKPGRDEQRVRQRYLRMSKGALIDRLISAERTLTEQRERWLTQQDEALTWRMRTEAAEAQLQEQKLRRSSSVYQKTEPVHSDV
ncbi:MAG TPA: hypothetical protein VFV38_04830 [Ktedonobacteraceae bacterium]|nr:hypothetical protein [Ktedonobacteraceae bacterium]